MPFTVKGSLWVSCREELDLKTAGSSRGQQVIIHEVGNRVPISLTCENVWSYENLEIPWPGILALDFEALPQGIPGVTKDLKTNQTLNMLLVDNLEDDTQVQVRYTLGGVPLPDVGFLLGPSNVIAQYDDKGEALLYQFVDGMTFEVLAGEQAAHIEIMLGTVSTLPAE